MCTAQTLEKLLSLLTVEEKALHIEFTSNLTETIPLDVLNSLSIKYYEVDSFILLPITKELISQHQLGMYPHPVLLLFRKYPHS